MSKTHLIYKGALYHTLCNLKVSRHDITEWCPIQNEYNGNNPTCEACILLDFQDPNKSNQCGCVNMSANIYIQNE